MKTLMYLLIILTCFACNQNSQTENDTSNQTVTNTDSEKTSQTEKEESKEPEKPKEDWVLIPNQKAGPITATSTEEDLIKIFGAKNVTTQEEEYGEGEVIVMTTLFKGTNKELVVYWNDIDNLKNPERVVVHSNSTMWKTENNIVVGTSLQELEKLNGKPFKLYGFGWDYEGTISSWDGGALAEKYGISKGFVGQLATEKAPGEGYGDILGDSEFSSDHKVIQTRDLKIVTMGIIF